MYIIIGLVLSLVVISLIGLDWYLRCHKRDGLMWILVTEIERRRSNSYIKTMHSRREMDFGDDYGSDALYIGLKDKNKVNIYTTDLCAVRDRVGRKWYGVILKRGSTFVFHSNYDTHITDSNYAKSLEVVRHHTKRS